MRAPEGVPRKLGACPPHGHSLQVTFPCAPPWAGGFPPKQRLGRPTAGRCPLPASGCGPELGPKLASLHRFPTPGVSPKPIPGLLHLHIPGLLSASPSSLRTPLSPPAAPGPAAGPGRRAFPPQVPTWSGPGPRPVSSASGRLPNPPGPAPLPGGYSLKPLRISLARSSLADMMRRPPRAAVPRWPGGASQTVPRSRGQSHKRAWRPRASSGTGQTRTGLSLPSAPAPDPFSLPLASERPSRGQWKARLGDWHTD